MNYLECMDNEDWCSHVKPDCSIEYTQRYCKKYCGLCGGKIVCIHKNFVSVIFIHINVFLRFDNVYLSQYLFLDSCQWGEWYGKWWEKCITTKCGPQNFTRTRSSITNKDRCEDQTISEACPLMNCFGE